MSDSLWWYEPGSPEWEREVSQRTDDTDWDALEASVRTGAGLWHVVITYPDGRRDILGPYQVDPAFGLALSAQEWDRRAGVTRVIEMEPLS